MNYNVLAEFGFNGRKYVFYTLIDKPYNMLYGYYEDGVIKPVIDLREIKIMREASRQIFISNNPVDNVKLNTIKYNGKLFQLMYDKVSKLIYFYEIKDNKFYLPIDDDLLNLSLLYNRQIFNSIDEENDQHEHHKISGAKKVILLAGIYVVALVSTIAALRTYTDPGFVNDGQTYEQPVGTSSPTKTPKTEFSLEKLEDALKGNTNLTDNEKIFLSDCLIVLDENSEYVEMDATLKKLKTLITIYGQDLGASDGTYSAGDNTISIAKILSFDDMNLEGKEVLVHEFFHCLSHPNYGVAGGLFEALTESLSCEFLGIEGGTYCETRQYLNMLCEIIGPKPVLAAYFSGDINCIINPLKQIIPDEELAYQLLSGINDFWTYTYAFALKPKLSEEEASANREMGKAFADNALGQYFLAAKGYPMEEDAIMSMYQSRAIGEGNRFYISIDGNEIPISGNITKGYFLNSFVATHPEATEKIMVTGSGYEESVIYVIDDSNRRLTPSTINEGAYVLQSKLLTEGVKKD